MTGWVTSRGLKLLLLGGGRGGGGGGGGGDKGRGGYGRGCGGWGRGNPGGGVVGKGMWYAWRFGRGVSIELADFPNRLGAGVLGV